jgi:LacI family transcriptional regulator
MAIRIGLQIEKTREHGRALLSGLADFALACPDWRLDMLDPEDLVDARTLAAYDGFIVRVMDDRTADALAKSGKPVVDTYGRVDGSPFDTIRLDDEAIARMAAGYFSDHRFETCAFCGFAGPRFSAARGEAFTAAVRRSGRTCFAYAGEESAPLADTFFRNERTDKIPDARRLADWIASLPKPIAVFCCNDIRAFQLIKACESEGVAIPDDVAVLGVDNDVLLATFTRPPLSSIDTSSFTLGRRAGELLAERLAGAAKAPRIVLHPPRRVIERASTEIYPFRTPWMSDAMVYIRRNLAKGISAKDVVARLGYSHTAVNNAFRAELGTSVHQEILRQRLALAQRLLHETDRPAARIAVDAGFLNPQYFSRAFSSAFGTTPDAWRREAGRPARAITSPNSGSRDRT